LSSYVEYQLGQPGITTQGDFLAVAALQ